MNYLQTYDKNFQRVGILVDAFDIQRKRRLNSDYELSFSVPMTSDDFREKIQLKGYVKDERGQFFVINERSRSRDGRKLTAQIDCSHIMFRMMDYLMPYGFYIEEAYGVHISVLTNKITSATGGKFQFALQDDFGLRDIKDFGRGNCMQALNFIVEKYGCEIEPDNFTIKLRKKIGADSGLQYRFQKNIIANTFKDNGRSIVTRMFSQMKSGLTFIGQPASLLTSEEYALLNTVPGAIQNGKIAVNYLISPYAGFWSNSTNTYFDGEFIDQNLEDPKELLEATRKALREQEVPALEVTVNAADLHKLDNTEPRPSLGDTVYLHDPEMGMKNLQARIVELTEYPFEMDKHSTVSIANVLLRDYADIIADLDRSKRIVDNLLSGGRLRADVFEEFARQAVIDVNNSKTEIKYDQRGIILQDRNNANNQVVMTSNGIMVTIDGGQTAKAAITARGIVAEQIIGVLGNFVSMLIGSGNSIVQINTNGIAAGHADFNSAPFRVDMQGNVIARSIKLTGQIDNSEMNTSTINTSVMRASRIIGNEIEGGTITGALIRTAAGGRRVEMNYAGLRTYDSGGTNRITINTGSDSGVSAISFYGSGGGYVGEINSYQSSGTLSIYGDSIFIGSNYTASPIYIQGYSTFNGDVMFNKSVYGLTIDKIEGLRTQLTSIWNAINGKSGRGHTHTVTTAHHNHGNPQNAPNTGGGTFTTTPD